MEYLDHEKVLALLPDRKEEAHKGNFGRVLLLCGSLGYTGAPALAARGALRTGAGLIYLGVPEKIYAIEAVKLDEPMVFPLPCKAGMLSEEALPEILERLGTMDVCLMGPGLGQSPGVEAVVRAVVRSFRGPLVLDADGINVMAPHKNELCGRAGPLVLTPHPGEFRRLGGDPEDRQKSAEAIAGELGAVVLLKGHRTLITDGNRTYCNTTGNPGMATGGSGDVLSGMILSLLGQGLAPLEAAAAGAGLHGAAGDLAARRLGQYAMTPTDLLTDLPQLLK